MCNTDQALGFRSYNVCFRVYRHRNIHSVTEWHERLYVTRIIACWCVIAHDASWRLVNFDFLLGMTTDTGIGFFLSILMICAHAFGGVTVVQSASATLSLFIDSSLESTLMCHHISMSILFNDLIYSFMISAIFISV